MTRRALAVYGADKSVYRAITDMLNGVSWRLERLTCESPEARRTAEQISMPLLEALSVRVHVPMRMYFDRLYRIGYKP